MHLTKELKNLPTDSGDRCRLIADIIEFGEGRWDQGTWVNVDRYRDPTYVEGEAQDEPILQIGAGFRDECGTAVCVAGWAVRLTPTMPDEVLDEWSTAGAYALGIPQTDDEKLDDVLFGAGFGWSRLDYESGYTGPSRPQRVAAFLRALAEFPEHERTFDHLVEHLAPDLANMIDVY